MWPFRRKGESSAAAGPSPVAAPVIRYDWAELPPIQRTVGKHPLTAPSDRFSDDLATHRDPSLSSDAMGHEVSAEAPAGIVLSLARPTTRSDGPAMIQRPRLQRKADGAIAQSGEWDGDEAASLETRPTPLPASVQRLSTGERSVVQIPPTLELPVVPPIDEPPLLTALPPGAEPPAAIPKSQRPAVAHFIETAVVSGAESPPYPGGHPAPRLTLGQARRLGLGPAISKVSDRSVQRFASRPPEQPPEASLTEPRGDSAVTEKTDRATSPALPVTSLQRLAAGPPVPASQLAATQRLELAPPPHHARTETNAAPVPISLSVEDGMDVGAGPSTGAPTMAPILAPSHGQAPLPAARPPDLQRVIDTVSLSEEPARLDLPLASRTSKVETAGGATTFTAEQTPLEAAVQRPAIANTPTAAPPSLVDPATDALSASRPGLSPTSTVLKMDPPASIMEAPAELAARAPDTRQMSLRPQAPTAPRTSASRREKEAAPAASIPESSAAAPAWSSTSVAPLVSSRPIATLQRAVDDRPRVFQRAISSPIEASDIRGPSSAAGLEGRSYDEPSRLESSRYEGAPGFSVVSALQRTAPGAVIPTLTSPPPGKQILSLAPRHADSLPRVLSPAAIAEPVETVPLADLPLAPTPSIVQRMASGVASELAPPIDVAEPALQRGVFDSVASHAGMMGVPGVTAVSSAAAGIGGGIASLLHSNGSKPTEGDMDELASKLYDKIRARLKTELLVDRERAGFLTDLR